MPDPELITPKSLKAALWRTCFHASLCGDGSILNKECVEFPGLVVSDSYDRRARKHTRTFYVQGDEREFTSIREAASAWNERRRRAGPGQAEQAA